MRRAPSLCLLASWFLLWRTTRSSARRRFPVDHFETRRRVALTGASPPRCSIRSFSARRRSANVSSPRAPGWPRTCRKSSTEPVVAGAPGPNPAALHARRSAALRHANRDRTSAAHDRDHVSFNRRARAWRIVRPEPLGKAQCPGNLGGTRANMRRCAVATEESGGRPPRHRRWGSKRSPRRHRRAHRRRRPLHRRNRNPAGRRGRPTAMRELWPCVERQAHETVLFASASGRRRRSRPSARASTCRPAGRTNTSPSSLNTGATSSDVAEHVLAVQRVAGRVVREFQQHRPHHRRARARAPAPAAPNRYGIRRHFSFVKKRSTSTASSS